MRFEALSALILLNFLLLSYSPQSGKYDTYAADLVVVAYKETENISGLYAVSP